MSKDICRRPAGCLLDVLRSLDDGGRDVLLGACKPAALGSCRLVCHELCDFIDESIKVLRVNLGASGTSLNPWPRFRCLNLDFKSVRLGELPQALEKLSETLEKLSDNQVHEVLLDFGTERCYTEEDDVARSVSIVNHSFSQLRKLHFLRCRFASKNVFSAVCRRLESCSCLEDLRLPNCFGLPERLPANLRKLQLDDWDLQEDLGVFRALTQLVELGIGCVKGDITQQINATQVLLASRPPKLQRLDLKFRSLPFCVLTLEPQLANPYASSCLSDQDAHSWRALRTPLSVHTLHVTPAETNLDQLSCLAEAFGLLCPSPSDARLDGSPKATLHISTVSVDGIRLHSGAVPLRSAQLTALRKSFFNGRVSLARLAIYPSAAVETVYQTVSLLGLPQRVALYGTALSYSLSACFPWTPAAARTMVAGVEGRFHVPFLQGSEDRAPLRGNESLQTARDAVVVAGDRQGSAAGSFLGGNSRGSTAEAISAHVAARVESLLHEAINRLPLHVPSQDSADVTTAPGLSDCPPGGGGGGFTSAVLISGPGVPSLPSAAASCPVTGQGPGLLQGSTVQHQQQSRKAQDKPHEQLHRELVDGWLRRHVFSYGVPLCWRALPAPSRTIAVSFKAPGLTAGSLAALRSALGQQVERVVSLEGLPDDWALSQVAKQVADERMQGEQSSSEDRFHLLLGLWKRLEELPRPVAVAVSHGPWWTR